MEVNHRGQHTHLVAADPVKTALRAAQSAEDIAAADDDGDLDTLLDHGRNLLCVSGHHIFIEADAVLAADCLATQFKKDSIVFHKTKIAIYYDFIKFRIIFA